MDTRQIKVQIHIRGRKKKGVKFDRLWQVRGEGRFLESDPAHFEKANLNLNKFL